MRILSGAINYTMLVSGEVPITQSISRRAPDGWTWLLWLGFTVGFGLQIYSLSLPYWHDEATAVYFISRPWSEMLMYVAHDMHGPVAFVLLKAWVAVWGDTPLITGLLPLSFSLVTLAYLWRLGQFLFPQRPAGVGVGVLLFWVSQTALFHGTDIWPYSVAIAWTTMSTYYLFRLLESPGQRYFWFLYFTITLLALYTHYSFLLVWYTHQVLTAWFSLRHRFPFYRWVMLQSLLFLGFAAWLPILIQQVYLNHFVLPSLQLDKVQGPWVSSLLANWRELLMSTLPYPLLQLIFWLPVTIALVGLVVRYQADPRRRQVILSWGRCSWPVGALATLVIVPSMTVAILRVSIWPWRYLTLVAPLFGLLVGIAVTQLPMAKRLGYWLVTVLVGISLLVNTVHVIWGLRRSGLYQWPAVARELNAVGNPAGREVIFFGTFEQRLPFQYYYHGPLPVIGFLPPVPHTPQLPGGSLGEVTRLFSQVVDTENVNHLGLLLSSYHRIWSVHWNVPTHADPEDLIVRWLEANCQRAGPDRFVPPRSRDAFIITPYASCRP